MKEDNHPSHTSTLALCHKLHFTFSFCYQRFLILFCILSFNISSVSLALLSSCYQTNVSVLSSSSSLPSLNSDCHPRSHLVSFPPSNFQFSSSSLIKHEPIPKSSTSMRAWTCHGRTHREMIDRLSSAGIIHHPLVKEAMLRVDRANYVLNPEYAYMDAPQLMYVSKNLSSLESKRTFLTTTT
jgi:hypothetical protein